MPKMLEKHRWDPPWQFFPTEASLLGGELPTNRKWVISLVINGINRVNPLITKY